MRDSDVVEKVGFAEALKGGGHQLYVRARLKCAACDHMVEKTFTADDFDQERMNPEAWICPEHKAKGT